MSKDKSHKTVERIGEIRTDLTIKDWSDALGYSGEMTDGHTAAELAEIFGIKPKSMSEKIRKMGDKVEHGFKIVIDKKGARRPVEAYKIKK